MAFQGRILTRSPFYIKVDGDPAIQFAKLTLTVWSGDVTTPPTSTYVIEKPALQNDSTDIIFEISALIKDFFDHRKDKYETGPEEGDVLWINVVTERDTGSGLTPFADDLYLATDGYGYYEDGANPAAPIFYVPEINVFKDGVNGTCVAIYTGHTGIPVVDQIKFLDGAAVLSDIDLSSNISSNFAKDKLFYTCVAGNVTEIQFFKASIKIKSVNVIQIEECIFNVGNTINGITFYDRNGSMQVLYMFKAKAESIRTSKSNYQSTQTFPYDKERHQFKDFNLTGRESITLNSGFIKESQNEVFRQLFLSEFVWVNGRPASVTNNNLGFKTRINDKLINYTISFDYASNKINDV